MCRLPVGLGDGHEQLVLLHLQRQPPAAGALRGPAAELPKATAQLAKRQLITLQHAAQQGLGIARHTKEVYKIYNISY